MLFHSTHSIQNISVYFVPLPNIVQRDDELMKYFHSGITFCPSILFLYTSLIIIFSKSRNGYELHSYARS